MNTQKYKIFRNGLLWRFRMTEGFARKDVAALKAQGFDAHYTKGA